MLLGFEKLGLEEDEPVDGGHPDVGDPFHGELPKRARASSAGVVTVSELLTSFTIGDLSQAVVPSAASM